MERRARMQNARLRMGTLTFVNQTRETVIDVTVHLNQLVADQPEASGAAAAIHLVSVFGGDVEIGAVAAAALVDAPRHGIGQQPVQAKGCEHRAQRAEQPDNMALRRSGTIAPST